MALVELPEATLTLTVEQIVKDGIHVDVINNSGIDLKLDVRPTADGIIVEISKGTK